MRYLLLFVVFSCSLIAGAQDSGSTYHWPDTTLMHPKVDTLGTPEVFKYSEPYSVPGSYYHFKRIGKENGVFASDLREIGMDYLNRLWFTGFQSGLGMIDGENVYRYSIKQGLGDRINQLLVASDGSIWVGSNGYGTYRIKGKIITHYGYMIAPDVHITGISEAADGSILIGTIYGGIMRFKGDSSWVYGAEQGITAKASQVVQDHLGRIWFLEKSNAVHCLTRTEHKKYANWPNQIGEIRRIICSATGDLIIVGDKGMIRLPNADEKKAEVIMADPRYGDLRSVYEDPKHPGSIVYQSENFLLSYDKKWNVIIPKSSFPEGTGRHVEYFYHDRKLWVIGGSSIMWLHDLVFSQPYQLHGLEHQQARFKKDGTLLAKGWDQKQNKGVIVEVKQGWDNAQVYETVPIANWFEDRQDRTWLITPDNDVGIWENGVFKSVLNLSSYQARFTRMYSYGDSVMVGSTNGLFVLHNNKIKDHAFKGKAVYRVARDGCGQFYLMFEDQCWLWKDGDVKSIFEGDSVQYKISALEDGPDGNVIVGTWGNYLYTVKCGKITHSGPKAGTHIVRTVLSDASGSFWSVGQATGIAAWNGKDWIGLGDLKGRIENDCFSVDTDPKGRIWIGTNEGFYRLDPKKKFQKASFDTLSYFLDHYHVRALNYSTGYIGGNGIYSQRSVYDDKEGGLLLVTSKGIFRYQEKEEVPDASAPSIFLKRLAVNREVVDWFTEQDSGAYQFSGLEGPYDLPKDLVLPFSQNHVSFYFGGLDWYKPGQVKYEFYLEGLETKFNLPQREMLASYSNLSAGKYIFHVRAINASGVRSKSVTLAFTILKPWYQTWWARTTAAILFLFIVYIIIRWRTATLRKRQQELEYTVAQRTSEVLLQKDEIEAQNKEIKDSIRYAKRIQQAILPGDDQMQSQLGEHMVLYQPKDIVAGDFYWLEEAQGKILLAAADCTGHGVPGAMVSVVCHNALNRCVREEGLIEPHRILDRTRELIIEEFGKGGEDVKDGMDIAMICLDRKSKTLLFAGAHNPLWIVRHKRKDGEPDLLYSQADAVHISRGDAHELVDLKVDKQSLRDLDFKTPILYEVKGDKQPIGNYTHMHAFRGHSVDLLPGDRIYVFTDGFQDQFGGDKGKKFKATNLKKLILHVQAQSFAEQESTLGQYLVEWKGDLEQIDDICLMGIGF